jgi:hypothetical protein
MSLIFIMIPAIQVKYMPNTFFLSIIKFMGKKYKNSLKVFLKVIVFLNRIERMLTQEPLQGEIIPTYVFLYYLHIVRSFHHCMQFSIKYLYLMWKNTVEMDRPQMTVCRIPRATDTHIQVV